MKCKIHFLILVCCLLAAMPLALAAPPPQKDYLSAVEADKIRDAETVNERIRLFLTFADDRLKKFQYELEHPSTNRHGDMLNSLLNATSAAWMMPPTSSSWGWKNRTTSARAST